MLISVETRALKMTDLQFISPAKQAIDPMDLLFDVVADEMALWIGVAVVA